METAHLVIFGLCVIAAIVIIGRYVFSWMLRIDDVIKAQELNNNLVNKSNQINEAILEQLKSMSNN